MHDQALKAQQDTDECRKRFAAYMRAKDEVHQCKN